MIGKTMTVEEIKKIIELHYKWLIGDEDGSRAILYSANLSGANLSSAILTHAILTGANLSDAILNHADLHGAILTNADLTGASLTHANLHGATMTNVNLTSANMYGVILNGANLIEVNLYDANLSSAILTDANLFSANLHCANLTNADATYANLTGANLSGAILNHTNLFGANLSNANLSGAKNISLVIAKTRIIPDGCDIIGWKKCKKDILVKLMIKSGTRRNNAFGRKCRAESVDVLEVIGGDIGISTFDNKTIYSVGKTVTCDKWDENFTNECSGGIHFFITREEAEKHV